MSSRFREKVRSLFRRRTSGSAVRPVPRIVLKPGEIPPRKCPTCGSVRLLVADDLLLGGSGLGGIEKTADVVFCDNCGTEWIRPVK